MNPAKKKSLNSPITPLPSVFGVFNVQKNKKVPLVSETEYAKLDIIHKSNDRSTYLSSSFSGLDESIVPLKFDSIKLDDIGLNSKKKDAGKNKLTSSRSSTNLEDENNRQIPSLPQPGRFIFGVMTKLPSKQGS